MALLGPNGAGKTTLVMHLNGILTRGHGSVAVAGLPVEQGNLKEIRRRVGLVFQDPDDQLFMPTPRPAVRAGAVRTGADPFRRGDRRRRPDPGYPRRPRAPRGTPPGAAVRLRGPRAVSAGYGGIVGRVEGD
ncbi:ATP-binding cassette domain-containing protein [Spongiactinospora gelatinilytica]|uniref:ATP-binding cassette domain-containing protein n=1 Tax=Spongiactinospora gelatinilytica TaxID=2666298 RepID=UPI001F29C0A0|nr:ATP-binding cassette domain-containing protein [Spongiactinospora gelatinilytica]